MPNVTRYVQKFGTDWQAWYIGLQPQWHIDAGPNAEDSVDIRTLAHDPPNNTALSNWDEIQKGSPNGFFMLLLALGWWGVGSLQLQSSHNVVCTCLARIVEALCASCTMIIVSHHSAFHA